MSTNSRDYYHSSSSSGGPRRTRRDDEYRDSERQLPPIREVLQEQLATPVYNFQGMDRALPEPGRRDHPSQQGPRLPPIQARNDYSSRNRQDDYSYNSDYHPPSDHYSRGSVPPPAPHTARAPPSPYPGPQGSYHVLAQSSARGELVHVSSSSTPQGIVRDHVVTAGQHRVDDPKKKFECHVCGRRMERQSVYNQHMITHTDQRPHGCPRCDKTFNSKSNLNRHLQSHGSRGRDDEDPAKQNAASSSSKYYRSSRRT